MRSLVPLSLVLILLAACSKSPTEPDYGGGPSSLSGRITFTETGGPAAGATVILLQAFPGHMRFEAVVDATGIYRAADIPSGWYSLSVAPPGAAPGEIAVYRSNVSLIPGANVYHLDISANRCVVMDGTVTARSTNLPIAGATVRFGEQTVTTGADGRYVLNLGCPPPDAGGVRFWSVTHPDYQPREFSTQVTRYSVTRDVVLDPR